MLTDRYIVKTAYLGYDDYELDKKRRIRVLAPALNIGFRYLYAPNLRWAITINAGWFSLSMGDYSVTLWNLEPSVSFQVFENIGLGIGYKYFKAKVDMNKSVWRGIVDLLYQGPLFSISGNF
jgi:hypothetical protein